VVGWERSVAGDDYVIVWRHDRAVIRLFRGQADAHFAALINDVNQIVCPVFFERLLLSGRVVSVFWDANEGRVVLNKQLPRGPKGQFWPTDLNNQGCIVGVIASNDQAESQAVLLKPAGKRSGK